jgi:hypothetical protein
MDQSKRGIRSKCGLQLGLTLNAVGDLTVVTPVFIANDRGPILDSACG